MLKHIEKLRKLKTNYHRMIVEKDHWRPSGLWTPPKRSILELDQVALCLVQLSFEWLQG